MKIVNLMPEEESLNELGRRLARIRKQQGYSQDTLAQAAGMGVATLRRIEAGQDSQLSSWLKLLKALGMSESIDALIPENFRSPMAEVLGGKKRRKQSNVADSAPIWLDEVKAP
jgi:transcriptional regulator with XRE-family HTH domain